MSTPSNLPQAASYESMSALLSWNDNNEPSSSVIRPVPKLLKTKHRGKQRKTQVYGINALCQLPVELIMEILLNLTPKDLLAIIFLCRQLYYIITDASLRSTTLWETARANERVPIPAPPPDLTEFQWAKLFFCDDYCHICGPGKSKRLTTLYSLGKRICANCLKTNLVCCSGTRDMLRKEIPFASDAVLPFLVPSDKDKSKNCILQPAFGRDMNTDNYMIEAYRKYYWKPDVAAMQWRIAMEHPEVFFGLAGSASAFAARNFEMFVRERAEHIQQRLQLAYECCEWERMMCEDERLTGSVSDAT
ncbi:hypothetical protein CPB85DRAFT_1440462 [Mucidula mucida]|nr:hypothetical protein CPB85DRAFT_1440462 [Mucidula mucida]